MPEHRRVLAARHGHVHDPRRHVHAPLRLLQRQDRQADVERPARARPRGADRWPRMGLRHAVITSVDRDDLPDLGAGAFVGVIRQIRRQAPRCRIEVLTPDFRGEEMPLARVIAERPDVFNHNVEVVPRLYPLARRGSKFDRSCRVLRNAKHLGGDEVTTKSGLMVGLGECFDEMVDALGTLRDNHVQVLTVGQYLRPTENHLPIVRYWHPDEFEATRAGRLRARVRARRRRAARAEQLPRRPARAAAPSPASARSQRTRRARTRTRPRPRRPLDDQETAPHSDHDRDSGTCAHPCAGGACGRRRRLRRLRRRRGRR